MIASLQGQIALRALRNNQVIEQFLGATDPSGPPGISWVTIWPYPGRRWAITLHEVVEVVSEPWHLLEELLPLEKRERPTAGRDLVLCDDPRAALEYAERVTGASRDRWVSCFKLDSQYCEWREAGRPPLR